MNAVNVKIVEQVLYEWGFAIRGDWGGIDGRSCKDEIHGLADLLFVEETQDVKKVRRWAGVCEDGNGHWPEHCDRDCPTWADEQARKKEYLLSLVEGK